MKKGTVDLVDIYAPVSGTKAWSRIVLSSISVFRIFSAVWSDGGQVLVATVGDFRDYSTRLMAQGRVPRLTEVKNKCLPAWLHRCRCPISVKKAHATNRSIDNHISLLYQHIYGVLQVL